MISQGYPFEDGPTSFERQGCSDLPLQDVASSLSDTLGFGVVVRNNSAEEVQEDDDIGKSDASYTSEEEFQIENNGEAPGKRRPCAFESSDEENEF